MFIAIFYYSFNKKNKKQNVVRKELMIGAKDGGCFRPIIYIAFIVGSLNSNVRHEPAVYNNTSSSPIRDSLLLPACQPKEIQ